MEKQLLRLILPLTLLIGCSSVVAQLPQGGNAEMIDSFGRGPNGDFKGRADMFMSEISKRPESQGMIVIYGSPAEVEARKRLCISYFASRRFPVSRLTYRVGGNVSEFRTDFWIIPAGAALPEIKPGAWIGADFGAVTVAVGKRKISSFFADKARACSNQVYIINNGTAKQIAQRETWLRNTRVSCGFDAPRITVVNGGPGPVRTVMWLVPPGSENLKP